MSRLPMVLWTEQERFRRPHTDAANEAAYVDKDVFIFLRTQFMKFWFLEQGQRSRSLCMMLSSDCSKAIACRRVQNRPREFVWRNTNEFRARLFPMVTERRKYIWA